MKWPVTIGGVDMNKALSQRRMAAAVEPFGVCSYLMIRFAISVFNLTLQFWEVPGAVAFRAASGISI
jgi:hypothetical protein